MNTISNFIIIDDDSLNNLLCRLAIKASLKNSIVKIFTLPEKGFQYIASKKPESEKRFNTAVLLDINMPSMTGWEFLKLFEGLDETIKGQYKIYILTSSVSHMDKEQASINNNIRGYIIKPLNHEKILSIA